jgi:hypothetical protein
MELINKFYSPGAQLRVVFTLKLAISFLIVYFIIIGVHTASHISSPPIIYVATDGSGN